MGNQDLIERYIYAVTKHMKASMKKDVAAELNSIIQDMLEERCQEVIPTEHDIKVVLTELGTPTELAQKYNGDSQDCLIGPPYYGTYRYVLRIVLACVAGGMFIAQVIAATTAHEIWFMVIFQTIGGILGGMLSAFAFVTLLFAFFYKRGIKVEGMTDSLDNLPPVPENKNKIPKADAIVGIIFSVIFTIIFLVCPQIICIGWAKNGAAVYTPFFNLDYIRQTWYFIILFGVLGITKDCVRLFEGSYTKKLMTVTVVTNVLDGVLTAVWLGNHRVMNPGFFEGIKQLFGKEMPALPEVFINFNLVFLAVILFALTINTVETVIRTLRAHGKNA